jgi:hypothetical protein
MKGQLSFQGVYLCQRDQDERGFRANYQGTIGIEMRYEGVIWETSLFVLPEIEVGNTRSLYVWATRELSGHWIYLNFQRTLCGPRELYWALGTYASMA